MTIPSLPTELWRLIIRSATLTGSELEGCIRETDLGWFSKFGELAKESRRTKIAITLVSRLFQQISSEFLHEHFFIDDLHSMRLADMLIESSSSSHGPCQTIKFIFVDAVYAAFRARMASQLVTILRLCCNLRGFSWIDCSKPHENNHSHDAKVIAHIPRNIQFFAWNARVPYSDLATFLRESSAYLRVVRISQIQHEWDPSAPQPSTTFRSLTHLRIDQSADALEWLIEWSTPSLSDFYLSDDRGDGQLERTLPAVARNLRSLRLGNGVVVTAPLLSNILQACPHLRDLDYHTFHTPQSPWSSNVVHKCLKNIAVTFIGHSADDTLPLRKHFGNISKYNFPLVDMIAVVAITIDLVGRKVWNFSL